VRIIGFGLVSATGLALDFVVFGILLALGANAFAGNIMSASCALTFVFFAALHAVFEHDGRYVWRKLACYLVYQCAAVAVFSATIASLAAVLAIHPALVKALSAPVSFYTNFLFMGALTEGRLRLH
jgi:hypothetical protein